MHDFDKLHTDRLFLRRPTADDVPVYFAIFGDPATNLFNPNAPLADLAAAEAAIAARIAHWDERGCGSWAVSLREQPDVVIGFGGLSCKHYGDTERMNLGYRFATTAWGRGLATELARASVALGWRALGLGEIWAMVDARHRASRHVLEKVGMRVVERVPFDGDHAPGDVWYRIERPAAGAVFSRAANQTAA